MPALRLMTYNVHLPSTAMAAAQGLSDTAVADAKAIARAIKNLPIRERPDVIAFNEVFHEGARGTLIQRLALWPHLVKKVNAGVAIPPEDSGLMLLSKLPFVPLPGGNLVETHIFANSAGPDQGASKGVAMVRVGTPIEPTTLVFTHMQASYDVDNSEHHQVREKQFTEIVSFLKDKLGPNVSDWQNVVLVGDLNVKGDPGATTSEWNNIFEPPGQHEFGTAFTDGWREHMHSPLTLAERDLGITNDNRENGTKNRLDYHCFKRVEPLTRQIVPHHLATPLRDLSDHWSLLGRIQLFSKASTPASAVDVLSLTPVSAPPAGEVQSELRVAGLTIAQEGGYQWAYVSREGTYSFFLTPSFELAVFGEQDFTREIAPAGSIAVAQLGIELQPQFDRRGFVPNGQVVVSRTPFFVRVRARTESGTGPCPLGVLTHRGESQSTAIILTPHLQVNPDLPSGQRLGKTDLCWFRADLPEKFDGTAYTSTFVLRNPATVAATVTARDAAGKAIPPVPGPSSAEQILTNITTEGAPHFLTLARTSLTDTKFTMEWQSPLTFLRLQEPITLHVDDETGADWPGEDELELELTVDQEPLLSDDWDDADTGEDWPDLARKVRDAVTSKLSALASDIAFDSGILVSVLKTDGISAHGSASGVIDPLRAHDGETEVRKATITISDPVSDGQVTFACTLSKFPSGHLP